MIKLTKPEINSLIHNYFRQESFIYTNYVFKNEVKDEMKSIRRDISLETLLTYGLQYMYGIEHFKDGKVNVCTELYSLDRLHLCDAVFKTKKRKNESIEISNEKSQEGLEDTSRSKKISKSNEKSQEGLEDTSSFKKEKYNESIKIKQTNSLCINEKSIKEKIIEENNEIGNEVENKQLPVFEVPIETIEKKSQMSINIENKSLTPCKPCKLATISDEYLFLYATSISSLYTFKFGSFINIKNIHVEDMIYVNDVLVIYDGNKLIFYNTFNLKIKSVIHKCKKILYDSNKFICLNFDDTISYYNYDGVKIGDHFCVIQDIQDGCSFENYLLIWNKHGKLCMINTKNQKPYYFSTLGTQVKSHCVHNNTLYLIYDTFIGIYDLSNKSESFITHRGIEGLCRTKQYLLTYNKNMLTVYEDNKIRNVYDTKKEVKKIIDIDNIILIVFDTTISFYDDSMQFIGEFECVDNIIDVTLHKTDLCVLLVNESPLSVSINF